MKSKLCPKCPHSTKARKIARALAKDFPLPAIPNPRWWMNRVYTHNFCVLADLSLKEKRRGR